MDWDSLPNYCFLQAVKGLGSEHACLVKVTSITRQSEGLRHLVEIRGKCARNLGDLLAVFGTHPHSPDPVSRTLYLGAIETPICALYEILASTSCFLIKESVQTKYLLWNVISESSGSVNTLVRKLRKGGVGANVIWIKRIKGGRRLTERQEKILEQAYERGFYESPHRTSVRQLAKTSGCSPSTLVRLLRKAEKKVLAEKFGISRVQHH